MSSTSLNIFSVYRLNKLGDSTQPCRTPFPILNSDVIPILFLQTLTVSNTVCEHYTCQYMMWDVDGPIHPKVIIHTANSLGWSREGILLRE